MIFKMQKSNGNENGNNGEKLFSNKMIVRINFLGHTRHIFNVLKGGGPMSSILTGKVGSLFNGGFVEQSS